MVLSFAVVVALAQQVVLLAQPHNYQLKLGELLLQLSYLLLLSLTLLPLCLLLLRELLCHSCQLCPASLDQPQFLSFFAIQLST